MERKILLVGAGRMAIEYATLLRDKGEDFVTVGRGEASAAEFETRTGTEVIRGGAASYLRGKPEMFTHAIVAVKVKELPKACLLLIDHGVRRILLEKPGGLLPEDIEELNAAASAAGTKVYIAYNRRFLSSVEKARELAAADGGVTSFTFEFTELSDRVAVFDTDREEKERWFLSNSSHVADLAFFLGGAPAEMDARVSGKLEWHPSASRFAGSGLTTGGVLFSYFADWDAPGRWGVELMTRNYRYILRPLEKLQVQERGKFLVEEVEIDDTADRLHKPGLMKMVSRFLSEDDFGLCTLEEQIEMFGHYCMMAGYK